MMPKYRLFGFIWAQTLHKMTNFKIFLCDLMHLNIILPLKDQLLPDDKFSTKMYDFSIYQNIVILGQLSSINEKIQNTLVLSDAPQYCVSNETSNTPG